MTLREKQSAFVRLVAELIQQATAQGTELTFGEAYRSPEEAAGSQPWGRASRPRSIRGAWPSMSTFSGTGTI